MRVPGVAELGDRPVTFGGSAIYSERARAPAFYLPVDDTTPDYTH